MNFRCISAALIVSLGTVGSLFAGSVVLPQGSTVRELLEKIYGQKPALRAHDKSILVGAGLEFVDRNYKLNPGEEIAIMPPVQGG